MDIGVGKNDSTGRVTCHTNVIVRHHIMLRCRAAPPVPDHRVPLLTESTSDSRISFRIRQCIQHLCK